MCYVTCKQQIVKKFISTFNLFSLNFFPFFQTNFPPPNLSILQAVSPSSFKNNLKFHIKKILPFNLVTLLHNLLNSKSLSCDVRMKTFNRYSEKHKKLHQFMIRMENVELCAKNIRYKIPFEHSDVTEKHRIELFSRLRCLYLLGGLREQWLSITVPN